MSNYDTSRQASDTALKAAKALRTALDPGQTNYPTYERLMLDLDWPILLAAALENAAVNGVSAELLTLANRLVALSHHATWTSRK